MNCFPYPASLVTFLAAYQVHWPDPPQPTAFDPHPTRPYVLVGLRSY